MSMGDLGDIKPVDDSRSKWIGVYVGILATLLAICGVGGGSGTYYKNNMKRRLKDVLRLRIVKAHKSFHPLFS